MKRLIWYIHGKGGSPGETERYAPLFPDCEVRGADYRAETPWEAASEFPRLFDEAAAPYESVTLIANSIGAYFAMTALSGKPIERAYFISPVVDMERLIRDMLGWAGVTEEELRCRGEIPTDFGETLSWEYLCYVREHPLRWRVPTAVLCSDRDELTALSTFTEFAEETGASLTVMEGGEHWFHTPEELAFLDSWLLTQEKEM